MVNHDQHHTHNEKPHGGSKPHEASSSTYPPQADISTDADWVASVEQTLRLGDQFVGFATGVMDLARTEILLAVRTLPNLMMLWLLMMPIMLLTWVAFSVLMAWAMFEASGEIGLGMLVFFFQQVLLLLACRWLYLKYHIRMTLPHTRAHINSFIQGVNYGSDNRGEAEK